MNNYRVLNSMIKKGRHFLSVNASASPIKKFWTSHRALPRWYKIIIWHCQLEAMYHACISPKNRAVLICSVKFLNRTIEVFPSIFAVLQRSQVTLSAQLSRGGSFLELKIFLGWMSFVYDVSRAVVAHANVVRPLTFPTGKLSINFLKSCNPSVERCKNVRN